MRNKRSWLPMAGLLAGALAAFTAFSQTSAFGQAGGPLGGQTLTALFPEGIPGYDTAPGVTVQSRARPAYDPVGARLGPVMLRPSLTVSIGHDDNVFGGANRRGSWRVSAAPSLLAATAWANTSLGLFLAADDTRHTEQPSQNRTSGSAVLGGTIGFGHDTLTLGAGHVSGYQDRTALDALPSDRPIAFQADDLRAAHALALGRFTLIPAAGVTHWRFANTTVLGVPVSQSGRDHVSALGGVTLRYAWMPSREIVFITRLIDTRYDRPTPGVPSNDSTSFQALAGIDHGGDAIWRWRLLAGAQYRAPAGAHDGVPAGARDGAPASAAHKPQTQGIAEAEVSWSPSAMTTARATLTRGIEDAAQTGLSSYTYTAARLTLDHEALRNVLLNASISLRHAAFEQTGGRQTAAGLGAGVTWLVNRELRVALTYDFAGIRNMRLPAGTIAGDYSRNLFILSLRTAL